MTAGDKSIMAENHIISFLDERIESCERKRNRNLIYMNTLKLVRIVAGVLAVLFVALLAADGFEQATKFWLNVSALVCTSLTALGSDLAAAFGFEKRFIQNVQTAGKLRTLRSEFQLAVILADGNDPIDYGGWHNSVRSILEGQSDKFRTAYEKAHKSP